LVKFGGRESSNKSAKECITKFTTIENFHILRNNGYFKILNDNGYFHILNDNGYLHILNGNGYFHILNDDNYFKGTVDTQIT